MIRCVVASVILLAARPLAGAETLKVASFSTILSEIAERVGGDRVEVSSLIKPGVDPHEFEPKPGDLKTVSEAKLILLSAKHMAGYVTKLRPLVKEDARLLEVGGQDPAATEDPHWWHSIDNMKRAVRRVRDNLIALDAEDADVFRQNAAKYLGELDQLEKWARAEIALLPRDQRKLVTSHDAFQYFARDYGFTIYPIEGISSADEPSSQQVAALVRAIKAQHVHAIFTENIDNPKVLSEITRESGAKIGGELYADGLGEGEAGNYAGMFRHNVKTIVNALK